MSIFLKNTTTGDLEFTFGDTIQASSTERFDHIPISTLSKGADLRAAIASGAIIINDGVEDLTPIEADLLLDGLFLRASFVKTLEIKPEKITAVDSIGTPIFETDQATGKVKFHGLTLPETDGTNSQVLTTDGSGNLSFEDPPPVSGASSLNELSDVDITSPAVGDALVYTSSGWINRRRNIQSGNITATSGNSKLAVDEDTTPVITGGTEVFSTTFTLNESSSSVRVQVTAQMASREKKKDQGFGFAVFKDSILIGGAVVIDRRASSGVLHADIVLSVGNTSVHTYSIRCGYYGDGNKSSWTCGQLVATDWTGAFNSANSVVIEELYLT